MNERRQQAARVNGRSDLWTLQQTAYQVADDAGWHEDANLYTSLGVGACLANIHGEVSEALEELRAGRLDTYYGPDGKPEGFGVELADIIIRVLDLAEGLDMKLEPLILEKLEYNRTRPKRHGGKLL